MTGFFEEYFGLPGYDGEHHVRCPFHNDERASASVNTEKRLFHCQACDIGFGETKFITKLTGCTTQDAVKLQHLLETAPLVEDWAQTWPMLKDTAELLKSYGIHSKTYYECFGRSGPRDAREYADIFLPATVMNRVVDQRSYSPDRLPKLLASPDSMSGICIPEHAFDKDSIMLICAGEKDMLTTREHGFNAITITGGENRTPAFPKQFEGKRVCIFYDNDDAGRQGARKVASAIFEYAEWVRVCDISSVCTEEKEDMTDFWCKYNGTKDQIVQIVNDTPIFTAQEASSEITAPRLKLAEALDSKYLNKIVRSNIQVSATASEKFVAIKSAVITKLMPSASGTDTMFPGQVKGWELTDDNCEDVLHLVDGNFKERDIKDHIMDLIKTPRTEKNIQWMLDKSQNVWKGSCAEIPEEVENSQATEMIYYSLCGELESGKKYLATYKICTHPYKGQQLIMVIIDAKEANDSISSFRVDCTVKESLKKFQAMPGCLTEKMAELIEMQKYWIGYDGNNHLIECIDLPFHTPLKFKFRGSQEERAYIDTLIVGESRVGKSSTAQALMNLYKLGTFTSLAGNAATMPALIGGSADVQGGGKQTKAGVIPRNNKGLIIFEEFGKCEDNITRELTDIRSSNEVRIARVNGDLRLPAYVRMISLTNVKASKNGTIKPIESYANGIAIVQELVPTAEDIARYDLIDIESDRGNNQINPYWEPLQAYDEKDYRNRIRWIWSRSSDQIVFTEAAEDCIVRASNKLNEMYDCHIKIFGTECWKKLCRVSIAVAGYVCSTDNTFTKIVVDECHVQYAANFLLKLYDNSTFKLKETVNYERSFSECDEAAVARLQELYIGEQTACDYMANNAEYSMRDIPGLSGDNLTGFVDSMLKARFMQSRGNICVTTVRFRRAYEQIDKTVSLRRVGETNAGMDTQGSDKGFVLF